MSAHANQDMNEINLETATKLMIELQPENLFACMKTKHLLDKLLQQQFHMVFPEKQLLGLSDKWIKLKTPPFIDLVEKEDFGYVIPFLPSLRNLLQNEEIRRIIETQINDDDDDLLKTVLNGSFYKENIFFRENKNAIAIIAHYDELGIANPLGSSAKKEKLGMFYWTIANLPPNYRSTTDTCQLLAIAKSSYLKKHGIETILKPFVDDIRKLQTEGISIRIGNVEHNYKGSLLFCAGDTPASAEIGGFKQSVSAYRPCRTCMTNQNQWRTTFNENNISLRHKEEHQRHVEAVNDPELPKNLKKFWSRRYGVNSISPLNSIPHFDVTQCLPQDAMHILIEGVALIATKALLHRCIVEMELFTIDDLNAQMSCFDFDYFKVNKPGEIRVDDIGDNGNLKQSASQMMGLVHSLPFFINEWIDNNEQAQQLMLNYVRLLQIFNVILSYEIHQNTIDILTRMIEIYVLEFNNLYPNKIVPKFHFLIHIPRYIKLFGPARQQWCFRFEAAHNYYKALVPIVRNFKNMPYTLSYRHQARLCFRLKSISNDVDKNFFCNPNSIDFGQTVIVSNLYNAQLLYDNFGDLIHADLPILRSPKVERYGTIYKPKSIILTNCDEYSLPQFGIICEIFVINEQILIVYNDLLSTHYSQLFNAYRVEVIQDNAQHAILIDNLIFPHPLPVFIFRNNKYVLLLNNERTEFFG